MDFPFIHAITLSMDPANLESLSRVISVVSSVIGRGVRPAPEYLCVEIRRSHRLGRFAAAACGWLCGGPFRRGSACWTASSILGHTHSRLRGSLVRGRLCHIDRSDKARWTRSYPDWLAGRRRLESAVLIRAPSRARWGNFDLIDALPGKLLHPLLMAGYSALCCYSALTRRTRHRRDTAYRLVLHVV